MTARSSQPGGAPEAMRRLAEGARDGPLAASHVAQLLGVEARVHAEIEEALHVWLGGFPARPRLATTELIEAGGKRARPLLAVLAAAAVGGDPRAAIPVAVAAELLHTATLLHDDVVDEGDVRRGLATARALFGNPLAVLAGDYAFFAAVDVLTRTRDYALLQHALDVARALVEGELMQLERRGGLRATRLEDYWAIVEGKTGALFGFAAGGGARLGGADLAAQAALGRYGHALGAAFQVVDDVLDLDADEAILGKQLGADLARGVTTLPLLYAAERDPEVVNLAERLAAPGSDNADASELVARVRASGAIQRSLAEARRLSCAASAELQGLPSGSSRAALERLACLVVERDR